MDKRNLYSNLTVLNEFQLEKINFHEIVVVMQPTMHVTEACLIWNCLFFRR